MTTSRKYFFLSIFFYFPKLFFFRELYTFIIIRVKKRTKNSIVKIKNIYMINHKDNDKLHIIFSFLLSW